MAEGDQRLAERLPQLRLLSQRALELLGRESACPHQQLAQPGPLAMALEQRGEVGPPQPPLHH